MKKEIKTFGTYVLCGGVAFLLHMSILTFSVEFFNLNKAAGSNFGFICAHFLNYFLQYNFTFKSTKHHKKSLFSYLLVASFSILTNSSFFFLFHYTLFLHYVLSQLLTSLFVFIINFSLNKKYTF